MFQIILNENKNLKEKKYFVYRKLIYQRINRNAKVANKTTRNYRETNKL